MVLFKYLLCALQSMNHPRVCKPLLGTDKNVFLIVRIPL